MLQRSLLRSSRSFRAQIPSQRTAVASSIRAAPSPFIRSSSLYPSSSRVAARWYSDATSSSQESKPAEGEKAKEGENGKSDEAGLSEVDKLKKEIEAKNKEILSLKDSYLRSLADYRNLQDRTARDRQQAHDFALQKFARDLLPSIDNLTHALKSVPAERLAAPAADASQIHNDLTNLHKGVQLMETVLLDVLKKHGLTKYDPAVEGEKFDPNIHDAVFMAPQPDKEDGTVFHTQSPGYMLNGRVLRAAQVGVVKNS
ncbi:uncharacterized protein PV09_07386 [Verruconis gallopava]|uniref:GrpE protein homolog n=1 Tax=Verruconis gallopava TaxID=253628 RepID=A0A0D2APL4_9PEZI|nr:uncharacterized protein PV09_07386 [Verruconis gallopava]KIW01099.1 hypothetical protein PV09_07386 [Verruconis gallopava]